MNLKLDRLYVYLIALTLMISLTACQLTQSSTPPPSNEPDAVELDTSPTNSQTSNTPSSPEFPIGGIELNELSSSRELDIIQQTNAYWIRNNGLLWSQVEPFEGERNWNAVSNLEEELKKASTSGYQVILIVRSTPSWAQREPGILCGPIKAEKLSAFASFMHDAVVRYSAPPFNVKYWELGNEPDAPFKQVKPKKPFGCWGDTDEPSFGGRYYGDMLKTVYPMIKAADPEAMVLVGGLLLDCDPLNPPEIQEGSGEYKDCSSSNFLEGVLQNGGGNFFDGISFHAYDYYYGNYGIYGNENWHSSWDTTGPTLIAKSHFLRDLLGEYGYPEKFLVNTEMALLCGGNDEVCTSDTFNQTKANYLAQSYSTALAEGLRGNIWYSLTGWRHSGLVDGDFNLLPAYNAYKFSLEVIDEIAFLREVTEFPQVKGYEFLKEGRHLWILWSLDGLSHNIQLPGLPESIEDVYGNPIATSGEIEIGLDPIYIHWGPGFP